VSPVATTDPHRLAGGIEPGATFAGYRIDAVAGRGGMGTVYRATQLSLGRTVALKVIAAPLLGDAGTRQRFEREARLAAMLDHPSIVAVHDAGEAEDTTFIAMQFVAGPDLRQLLAAEHVSPARAVHILGQIAGALDAAHAAGLVHRDVKPANILVGAGDRAFLTDFGLTRLAAATDGPTEQGEWVGSPDYIAPEQIRAEPVGAPADVYALGCVLFRALAGRAPFPRETRAARLWAHVHDQPPLLSELAPELAPLDAILARALSKQPSDRQLSAGELAGEAARALGHASAVAGAACAGAAARRPRTGPAERPAPAPEPDATHTEVAAPGPSAAANARIASRTLVGRDCELAALRAAVERAAAGAPSLTIVAGEAGIGKSRLVGELARGVHAGGAFVLAGACLGLSGGDVPYAPIVAALRALAAGPHVRVLDAMAPQARAELARLVPELGAGPPPACAAGEPGRYAQARLFELLLGVLRQLSRECVTVLVVEDLQWADPSTRDFLRYVVAHARDERLAVVATYRSDEIDRRHPVRALLVELARSERVRRVELARLGRPEIARQLASVIDATPARELVDEIFERSQGNPFFAEELLATRRAGTGDALPASLREALLVRVDALSPAAADALRVVAAIGRPAEHALLAGASGSAECDLLGALREAVSAHVLVRDGERLDFRHALMREALYDDLLPGERAALHGAVARTLAETSGSPGELARHWHAAGDLGRATVASVDAGLHAAGTYAFGEALEHFARALELWPHAQARGAHAVLDHAGLLAEAAEAARLVGDVERAIAFCERALGELDDSEQPARAAHLHERIGRYRTWDPELALTSYGRALALLGAEPGEQRARVLGDEGLALMYLDRLEESRRRCEDALGVARAAGAPAEEAYARSTLGVVLAFLGLPAEGEAHLRAALAIAQRLGRAEDIARGHIHLAEVLRYRGRIGDALAITEEGERVARRLGIAASFGGYLAANAAEDLYQLGRWGTAARRLEAAGFERLEPTGRQLWLGVAGRLAIARGDADAGRRQLEAACALSDDGVPHEQVGSVYSGLAELELWNGRPGEARRLVAAGLALLGDGGDALNTPALLSMGVRAHADAATAAGAGADERRACRVAARALTARLKAMLDLGDGRSCPPQARAHLALCEAELARLERRPSAQRWQVAIAMWDELAQPYPAAYARLREAEAVVARGPCEHVPAELCVAREAAQKLGAVFLLDAVRHLERTLPRAPALLCGSSGKSLCAWAVAGAGWQGRSEGVAP
jgi:tetratricopeptide (TPR) repeat protein